ncbi:MAG: hypothetical protein ACTSO8_05335, partial [Promethearchaeota archaeon]
MNERDNKREENEEFDESESDPTKEAFFSDMENMEEEIASEAIELVRHALSLINLGFFDDGIEVLRQAIGEYAQINKLAEIEALNSKIEETYLLKEKAFRERELERESRIEIAQGEAILEQDEDRFYKEADSLIVKAIELVNKNEFDEALDTYDDARKILKNLRKSFDIEKVNELIEDCYNRKAEFLRKQNILTTEETTRSQQEPEGELSELELKAQKIRAFEDAKRKENEKSNQAYELIGKATELSKIRQYDEALRLFEESVSLFEEINWINEVKKIKSMIEQVEIEKERFLLELQRIKAREQQEFETKKQQETQLIERAKVEEQIKQQAQAEKLRDQVEKKQEDTIFQNEISEMVDYAEKLARDYDLNMKKEIKKGKLVEKCIYPTVIKIYEEVKQKVIEKGWKDQVGLYDNQISHYNKREEKDKKLRQIETKKLQKQKDYEVALKSKEDKLVSYVNEDQLTQLKEQRKGEDEIRVYRENIEESVKRAEIMAREYDSYFKKAVKTGNLNFDSKYPEIIKIFTEARDKVLAKGWKEDAVIYSTHIRKYTELFDKEKRIRELETKKDEKKRIYEEFQKPKRDSFDAEKLKHVEAQKMKEYDEKKFQDDINALVDKAEKMARDYDVALKKALKEGKAIEEEPYSKIIEIYSRIKDNFILKGWKDESKIYGNQIKLYQQKYEKDKRLRELEAGKFKKQIEFEESLKETKETKPLRYQELKALDSKDREIEEMTKKAMKLIDEAESVVRSYELSLKKDILIYKSPYEQAILNYENARKLFKKIGWNEEAHRLMGTINFYKDKKIKDDNLRA